MTLRPALLTKQLITIAPRSWHSRGLYGRHSSTPFIIQGTGEGEAGPGREGGKISTSAAVLSTRVPVLRYFG